MNRALPIFLLLLGCRDKVSGTGGELRLGRTRVDFPSAFVGQTKRAQLEVTNTSRSPRRAQLATQPPFVMQTADIEVPGASTIALELTFIPEATGHFEQPLALEVDDGAMLQALLVGTAEPPLDCAPSSPCRSSAFDLASGSCIESAANEGLECSASNACYATATCVSGECVGTARSCDDQDACSTDLCDPVKGCFHFANTARCAAPPDPCHLSACDPVIGCTFVDAPDGTRCGPSDCSTAQVCLLGQCKTLMVPEGAACGPDSPCQARGRCIADVCVRPAASSLVTAWTVWAPWGERVDWDAIADTRHNVYWRERVPGSAASRLVSVTAAGAPRWTQNVDLPQQVALIDDVLVVRKPEGFEGRRPSDGVLLWSRDFTEAGAVASTKAYSRGLGGSIYVGYMRRGHDGLLVFGSTLASLNVFTGSTLWQVSLPAQAIEEQTMPADEAGYVYVGTWGNDSKRRYLAFTPAGVQRWSFVNPHASPAAVFGGRVYHWDHWLSETVDGGWVNKEDPKLATSGYPRLALGAISYVGAKLVDAGSCSDPGTLVPSAVMKLVRVDPPTSREQWSFDIGGPGAGGLGLTNPVLTSTSSVMFSQPTEYCSRAGQPHVLREISASGEPSFSCALPGPEAYIGEGLLSGGKWIAAIQSPDGGQFGVRAILLPGFDLPAHGWSTAWGSSARDNHAR